MTFFYTILLFFRFLIFNLNRINFLHNIYRLKQSFFALFCRFIWIFFNFISYFNTFRIPLVESNIVMQNLYPNLTKIKRNQYELTIPRSPKKVRPKRFLTFQNLIRMAFASNAAKRKSIYLNSRPIASSMGRGCKIVIAICSFERQKVVNDAKFWQPPTPMVGSQIKSKNF